jgi:hypothetical protein
MKQAAVERLFEDRERSSLDDSFAVHWEGEDEPVGVVSLANINHANSAADLSVIVGDERIATGALAPKPSGYSWITPSRIWGSTAWA